MEDCHSEDTCFVLIPPDNFLENKPVAHNIKGSLATDWCRFIADEYFVWWVVYRSPNDVSPKAQVYNRNEIPKA